jgi:hypothetical protein
MSGMLHDLRIHQKFIAILLHPLVLLAALAAGRIRFSVTKGVRAGRGHALVVFTVTLAGLANELQKERGLSAVYIGNPSSGPQNVNRSKRRVICTRRTGWRGLGRGAAGRWRSRLCWPRSRS